MLGKEGMTFDVLGMYHFLAWKRYQASVSCMCVLEPQKFYCREVLHYCRMDSWTCTSYVGVLYDHDKAGRTSISVHSESQATIRLRSAARPAPQKGLDLAEASSHHDEQGSKHHSCTYMEYTHDGGVLGVLGVVLVKAVVV